MLEILTLACATLAPQDPPSQPQRIQPMPVPRAIACRRGDRTLVVDGSLQDWPALPPLRLDDTRQVSGTSLGAYRARGDLAGRLFLLWDDEALWIGASVLDDWHVRLTADSPRIGAIPPADSLEIWIDPNRDTRSLGADRGRSEDAEFWIADVEKQERLVVNWDRFRGGAKFVDGGQAVVLHDEKQKTTTYEVKLPWSSILPAGSEPKARQVFDLQLVLNDYDAPTDPLPQTRIGWTFGTGPKIDPGLLGSVMLLDVDGSKLGASGLPTPEFPPAPEIPEPAIAPRGYWTRLFRRVHATKPAPISAEIPDASHAGGSGRREALLELDGNLAKFPFMDFLGFQHRIHRRMNRECAGIVESGLPYMWDQMLDEVVREIVKAAPEDGYRLIRLPQGGWVVRSAQATFAIDPAGFGVDRKLFPLLGFVLSTDPIDPSKRNDQLALRMIASKDKRPFVTHVALQLPGVPAEKIPLVVPNRVYSPNGLKVRVLGKADEDGRVSRAVGYDIRWPNQRLVVTGRGLLEEQVDRSEPIGTLLLSARHSRARVVGQRMGAQMTVLDDVLQATADSGANARASLRDAWKLQEGLRPRASVILGPGESIDISW